MIHINRKYNNDPLWCIGYIEMIERGHWIWTSFDIKGDEWEIIEGGGCEPSRAMAESAVRQAWREQLKSSACA